MKKFLLALIVIAVLGTIAVYVFIPKEKSFTYSTQVKCNQEAASRYVIDKSKWKLWWPGEKKSSDTYEYKQYEYKIDKILLNAVHFTITSKEDDKVGGTLRIAADTADMIQFVWNSVIVFSSNPFARLVQYSKAKSIMENVDAMLSHAKLFFEKQENVYGMKITVETAKDTSLVSFTKQLDHYPSTEEVYAMEKTLAEYISKKGAKENGNLMLHVQQVSTNEYVVMIGKPILGDVTSEGEFKIKKMVPGNILTGEVRGGTYTIINAEDQLKNFVTDYRRISPAIPYQSLVTNRLIEKDTSKWVTRLYYPIF